MNYIKFKNHINILIFSIFIAASHFDFRLSSHIFLIWLIYNFYYFAKSKNNLRLKTYIKDNKLYISSIAGLFTLPFIAILLHGCPINELKLWTSQFRGEIIGIILPFLLLINNIKIDIIYLVSLVLANISMVYGYYSYFLLDAPRLHAFITDNPNVYSTYLLITFCFCFYGLYYLKKYRVYSFVTLINIFLSLLIANSRGCILLFFVAVFIFSIIILRKNILCLLMSLLILISGFGTILYFNQPFQQRIISTFKQSKFDNDRYVIYDTAVNIVDNNLFVGIGKGNFRSVYQDYNRHKEINNNVYYHVHQIVLEMMVESGILGLIAFFIFIFGQIKVYIKGYLNNNLNMIKKYAALMCLFITCLVFAYMQVENTYFALRKIYWIYISIGYYLLIRPEPSNNK